MDYLITGGAGFIGSHLTEVLLARGDSVVVLDDLSTGIAAFVPDGVELVTANLLNLDTVERAHEIIEMVTSTGGSVAMPFEQAPWGDHYGQVKDRYGVLFHLNVEGDHSLNEGATG